MDIQERPKHHLGYYTVGWVCVTHEESLAALALLDEIHEDLPTPSDECDYTVGKMGRHNVIIVKTNNLGPAPATFAATHMIRSFKNIRYVLLVGIGGGATNAPSVGNSPTEEIFLGDVVVGLPRSNHGGVIDYDTGDLVEGKRQVNSHTNKPRQLLLSATSKLRREQSFRRGVYFMPQYIQQGIHDLDREYAYPGEEHDILFAAHYECTSTERQTNYCEACDKSYQMNRSPRGYAKVHYGLIASGNVVVKDGKYRDRMRSSDNVLCFEMEAAGLMDTHQCLVIRGISDYADSHKNKLWQPHAALTAAAYAKDLLRIIEPEEVLEQEPIKKLNENVLSLGEKMDHIIDDKERDDILNQLSRLDCPTQQQTMLRECAPRWERLLDAEVFKLWVKGEKWQLCLYGEAGVGKTYLCALVVERLLEIPRGSPLPRPVIYAYLKDEDQQKERALDLLGSLVRQMIEFHENTEIPARLKRAYQNRHPPVLNTMKEVFEELLEKYDRTYLIIDGLYRHTKGKDLALLNDYFRGLIEKGLHLSLLTTALSYREVLKEVRCDTCFAESLDLYYNCSCNDHDFDICPGCKKKGASCQSGHISKEINDTVYLQVRPLKDEILPLCYQKLHRASGVGHRRWDARTHLWSDTASGVGRYLSRDPRAISMVAEKIAVLSQGNLLIASTWLDVLLESDKQPNSLGELGTALDIAWAETLTKCVTERITNLMHLKNRGDEYQIVCKTIPLVLAAYRPISILALQHAMALQHPISPTIEKSTLPRRDDILNAANGMLVIDKADEAHSMVRLFHGPISIVATKIQALGTPHVKMANLCLDYFSSEDYSKHCENIESYPFLFYALEHWGDHIREAYLDTAVETRAYCLLSQPDTVKLLAQNASGRSHRTPSLWIHDGVDALHLCAWFNLTTLIERLVSAGHAIDKPERQFRRTPLQYACVKGNLESVTKLLELQERKKKVSLQESETLIKDTIEGLIDTDRSQEEARRVKIVELILRKHGRTLDSAFDMDGKTVLMYAAEKNYPGFVRKLLENGMIDVNSRDKNGCTALWFAEGANPIPPQYAHLYRGESIAEILLEHGADRKTQDLKKRAPDVTDDALTGLLLDSLSLHIYQM